MFWQIVAPKAGGDPSGPLADHQGVVRELRGIQGRFQEGRPRPVRERLGVERVNTGGKLTIESTPNQDSPVMEGRQVVMGVDVAAYAYYLKYQNRRADYVDAWWSVVSTGLRWRSASFGNASLSRQ